MGNRKSKFTKFDDSKLHYYPIPKEILTLIFFYLHPSELPFCVCKSWYCVMQTNEFWSKMIHFYYPREKISSNPKKQFISLLIDPPKNHPRRVMNLILELHKMGYPIEAYTSLSPAASYWRLRFKYTQPDSSIIEERYSSIESKLDSIFGIPNVSKLSKRQLAIKFIEKYKLKPKEGNQREKLFMRWYEKVCKVIGKDDYIYEDADWIEPPPYVRVWDCDEELKIPFFNQVYELYEKNGEIHAFVKNIS